MRHVPPGIASPRSIVSTTPLNIRFTAHVRTEHNTLNISFYH
jgi:hypothetical protein